jgi:hypothetical protein
MVCEGLVGRMRAEIARESTLTMRSQLELASRFAGSALHENFLRGN